MKELVTIVPIRISKQGQQHFFQLRLPTITQRIVGIETGLRLKTLLPPVVTIINGPFKRNVLMGTLQLTTPGRVNQFYATDVYADDTNIGLAEIQLPRDPKGQPFQPVGLPPVSKGGSGKSFYEFFACTHGSKREEDSLDICGSRIINGWYKDTAGGIFYKAIPYEVLLYVWTEQHKQ
jgi:hypothetical protein